MYIDEIKLEFQNCGLSFAYTIYWDIYLYWLINCSDREFFNLTGELEKWLKLVFHQFALIFLRLDQKWSFMDSNLRHCELTGVRWTFIIRVHSLSATRHKVLPIIVTCRICYRITEIITCLTRCIWYHAECEMWNVHLHHLSISGKG